MRRQDGRQQIMQVLEGKPIGLGLFAVTIAGYGLAVVELLQRSQTQGGLAHLASPKPAADWLRMYRRSRRMWAHALVIEGTASTGKEGMEFIQAMKWLGRASAEGIRTELERIGKKELRAVATSAAREYWQEIQQVLNEVEQQARGILATDDELDASAIEIQFFARVWIPCMILFRTPPAFLLRRARCGDLDAIRDLASCDKTILADPRVIQHVCEASLDKHGARIKRIGEALYVQQDSLVRVRRLKYAFAGLIAAASRLVRNPFKEPQLRKLFDGFAIIRGQLRDTDIPVSSEAFAKAIQRETRRWRKTWTKVAT